MRLYLTARGAETCAAVVVLSELKIFIEDFPSVKKACNSFNKIDSNISKSTISTMEVVVQVVVVIDQKMITIKQFL